VWHALDHHHVARWALQSGESFFTEINDGRFYDASRYLDYVAERLVELEMSLKKS
jgi:hypothetical protein